MQVLVIGGEPALRRLLAGALERAGHAVDEAGSAADAAAPAARDDVDTMFLMIRASGEGSLRRQLRALEAQIIARVLQQANHDRRVAAERLGIGLSSLYRKLDEFERLGSHELQPRGRISSTRR
jgi:two-component system response regulator AtoC